MNPMPPDTSLVRFFVREYVDSPSIQHSELYITDKSRRHTFLLQMQTTLLRYGLHYMDPYTNTVDTLSAR